MLFGVGLSARGALYHADGAIGALQNGVFQQILKSYSYDLGVQAGGGVNYDFPGVHAQAESIAEGFGVHSHTYSQQILPVVSGSEEIDATSTAIAIFSD